MASKKQTKDEAPLDVAPFEMLTQKQQWDHLLKWHTWEVHHNLNSKSRKDDYEAAHSESHLRGEHFRAPHTHTAVAAGSPPPEDPTASGDLANSDLSRPLNVTQRRALKDLVENDFLAMRAEIQQMADDLAKDKRVEITEEWAARGADADAFEKRGKKIMDVYTNAATELITEARRSGVALKMPRLKDTYSDQLGATVTGLDEALRAAEQEIDADRRRALNALERSRLVAQRKVLLTGVTQEALGILDTIPTAQELMLQAAAQRAGQPMLTGARKK